MREKGSVRQQYMLLPLGAARVGVGLHDRVVTVATGMRPRDPCLPAPAQR